MKKENDLPDMGEYLGNNEAPKEQKYRLASVLVNIHEAPITVDFVEYAQGLTNQQIKCHIHEAREEGFNYMAERLERLLYERKTFRNEVLNEINRY